MTTSVRRLAERENQISDHVLGQTPRTVRRAHSLHHVLKNRRGAYQPSGPCGRNPLKPILAVGQKVKILERVIQPQYVSDISNELRLVELFASDVDLESAGRFIDHGGDWLRKPRVENALQPPSFIVKLKRRELAPAVAVDGVTKAEGGGCFEEKFCPHSRILLRRAELLQMLGDF